MNRSLGLCPLLLTLAIAQVGQTAGASTQEEDIAVLKEQVNELNSRLDEGMTISGYVDTEYSVNNKKGGDANGIRIHHLSLFFEKRVTEKWRFFSEIEYEDGPLFDDKKTTEGKIYAEAVNLSYLWRSDVNLRGGRFFTPAGIWNIDHYPPFVPTQERPLHVRNIFPQIFDGAMVYGTRPVAANTFLKYDLYLGNGEGNTGKNDGNREKAVGLNAGLLLPFLKHTEVGLTYYRDTLNNGTDKTAIGTHAKVKAGSFAFQGEYASGNHKPTTGSDFVNTGYYAQFMYNISHWTLGMRHSDYDKNSATDAIDNKEVANSVFVNYHINHALVLKLEHHRHSYDDAKKDPFRSTMVSVVAYLGS